MSRATYDAVIVGARVAGAATALLLARAGARVLLVDRQPEIGDTLSTHALMRPAVELLAAWATCPEAAPAGAIMPLMLLSGLLTPVRNMPLVLQIATYANPLRFGIDTVRRVYLEGATFADVAPNFIPLLAVAVVTLPLAAWLFRNRLG